MTVNCRYCDKPLSLLQRLAKQEFCSAQHRKAFDRERDDLALQRLMESRPGPGGAKEPAGEPAPEPAAPEPVAAAAPEPPPPPNPQVAPRPPEPEPVRAAQERPPRSGGRRIITLGPISPEPVRQEEAPPPPEPVPVVAAADPPPGPAVTEPPMRDLRSLIDALELKPASGLDRLPEVLPFAAQPLPPLAAPRLTPDAALHLAGEATRAQTAVSEPEAGTVPALAPAATLGVAALDQPSMPRVDAGGAAFTFARRTIVPPPRLLTLAERTPRAADIVAGAPPQPETCGSGSVAATTPQPFPRSIATEAPPAVPEDRPPTSRLDAWSRARQVAAPSPVAAEPGSPARRQDATPPRTAVPPAGLGWIHREPAIPPAPPVFESIAAPGGASPSIESQEPGFAARTAKGPARPERNSAIALAPPATGLGPLPGYRAPHAQEEAPRMPLRPATSPVQALDPLAPCTLAARMPVGPVAAATSSRLAGARPAALLSLPDEWVSAIEIPEEISVVPVEAGVPPLRPRFQVRLRAQDFPALPVRTPVACAFSRPPQDMVHHR